MEPHGSFIIRLALDLGAIVGVNLVLWVWVLCVPTVVMKVRWLHLGAQGLALPGVILLRNGSWRSRARSARAGGRSDPYLDARGLMRAASHTTISRVIRGFSIATLP
ncbi:MAG: hypothetical protein IPM35_17920 [Myxococcales bacterium]|nr:hypothetical protein [Myxococcales bacterium]